MAAGPLPIPLLALFVGRSRELAVREKGRVGLFKFTFSLQVIWTRFFWESAKGLRCNSLSCSSSISEVTMGPKQQHKDARWIRGDALPLPVSFYRNMFCLRGIQKADDRRPQSPWLFLPVTPSSPQSNVLWHAWAFVLLLELSGTCLRKEGRMTRTNGNGPTNGCFYCKICGWTSHLGVYVVV